MATTLDRSRLPQLKSRRIADILAWEDELTKIVRLYRQDDMQFDAGALVPKEIVDAWTVLTNNDIDNFPADFHEAAQTLATAFCPRSTEERLALLRSLSFRAPTTSSTDIPTLVHLAKHVRRFRRVATALSTPDALAMRTFAASLQGVFGKLVADDNEYTPATTLDQYIQLAVQRAQAIDAARSSGILDLAPGAPTRHKPLTSLMQASPRPAAPGSPRIAKLTPEERERLIREGGCLRCRQPGHFVRNCPLSKQQPTSMAAAAPAPRSTRTPSPQPAPQPPAVPKPEPVQMLRRSTRPPAPRKPFSPAHSITAVPEACAHADAVPQPVKPTDSSVAIHVVSSQSPLSV